MKRFSKMFEMFIIFVGLVVILSCSNQVQDFSSDITYDFSSDGEPIDVIILAGQSNMAGCGIVEEANQYFSIDEYNHIKNGINGITIFVCNDFAAKDLGCYYLPYSNVSFENGPFEGLFGPEVGFALEYQKTGRNLVLIKYTAGGMPLGYFMDAGDISQTMKSFILSCCLELVKQGYEPNIKGFCWMQGENNCDYVGAHNYYKDELLLIKYIRRNFNDKLLFIDARVTDWQLISPNCYQDVVNQAKEKIAKEEDLCYLIDSTGLIKGNDRAHYDTPSIIELGRRFAKEFLANF